MPTQRLPNVGSDDNSWGTVLNGFLGVSLNSDGTISSSAAVLLSGAQSIAGTKTFTSAPIMPGLQVTGGTPGTGKVLTSDISGNASWGSPTGGATIDTTSTDIAALGSRAAGSVGLAADAGHVHPTTGLVLTSTVTTKGDIYAASASATPARLGVGSDGSILFADSSQTTGLNWGDSITGYGGPLNLQLRSAGGTNASPTAITSGTNLGQLGFGGQYDTTVGHFNANTAGMYAQSAENFSSSAAGTGLNWFTTPTGSTTPAETMSLTAAGDWQLPSSTAVSSSSITFTGTSSNGSSTITSTGNLITAGVTNGMPISGPGVLISGNFTVSAVSYVSGTNTSTVTLGFTGLTQQVAASGAGTGTFTVGPYSAIHGGVIRQTAGVMINNTFTQTSAPSNLDPMVGTGLLVVYNQTLNYAPSGGAFDGPYTATAFKTLAGLSYPRGVIELEGTFVTKDTISALIGVTPAFQNVMGYKNDPSVAANVVNGEGFVNAPTVVADSQSISFPPNGSSSNAPGNGQGWSVGFWDGPVFATINGGSLSGVQQVSYSAASFLVGTSGTIRIGYYAPDVSLSSGGSMTTQYGIMIGTLALDGVTVNKYTNATNNIGIANTSTTIYKPSAQTVASSPAAITANASVIELTSTAARTWSTGSATIAAPATIMNGQTLQIINANTTAANTMTFTSGSSTLLSLGCPTRVVGAGGSLSLVYDATYGGWVETGFSAGASAGPRVVAMTPGSTITPNCSTTEEGTVTLASNATLAAPTGTPVDGQRLILRLQQDATGSRTVTWNAIYHFGTTVAMPTLSTAATKTDYIGFVYNVANTAWECIAVALGY